MVHVWMRYPGDPPLAALVPDLVPGRAVGPQVSPVAEDAQISTERSVHRREIGCIDVGKAQVVDVGSGGYQADSRENVSRCRESRTRGKLDQEHPVRHVGPGIVGRIGIIDFGTAGSQGDVEPDSRQSSEEPRPPGMIRTQLGKKDPEFIEAVRSG